MEFFAILFIFCFIVGVIAIIFILKYYKQDLDEIVDELSKRKPK